MGMNMSTSFAPMSFIGASYRPGITSTGGGIGMSVSPQYGTHMNYIGPSSSSVGINGMAPAPTAKAFHPSQLAQHPHQPMNSFGNMGSYLGRGSLNTGFSLSNSGYGLPYGASLTGNAQPGHGQAFPHTTQVQPAGMGTSVGAFVPPGMGNNGGERSRELEAKFVKDFQCCGLQLNGLHDLLEQ
jgi:transcription factor SFP1